MRSLRHLSPRYVVDRSAVTVWQRRHPFAPWLTSTAVDLLTGWVQAKDTVFEWGSGRSTAWFAAHAGRVISVEHNPNWYESVSQQLSTSMSDSVERHLRPSRDGVWDETGEAYVSVIDLVDDQMLDIVLVDGIHRDECAQRCLSKLRPGGLLIVDNADWFVPTTSRSPRVHKLMQRSDGWQRFETGVEGWRRIDTTNGVWDTVFWVRPTQVERVR